MMIRRATPFFIGALLFALVWGWPNELGGYGTSAVPGSDQAYHAYFPITLNQGQSIYHSSNLAGHNIFAECNPGGISTCPCSEADVAIGSHADYGEVTSNVREINTYVNAIGYHKFTEFFPDGSPITLGVYRYTGQFRLPLLPAPNIEQRKNPEAGHMMIQFWDGRDALHQSGNRTLEGTIFWTLNPWTAEYGHIKIYTESLALRETGIVIMPDNQWHTFELTVDLASRKYVSVSIDREKGDVRGVPLATVYQPEWGNDISLSITTESSASWPQNDCHYVFTWTMQYKDLELSKLP